MYTDTVHKADLEYVHACKLASVSHASMGKLANAAQASVCKLASETHASVERASRVWDIASGRYRSTLSKHSSLAI